MQGRKTFEDERELRFSLSAHVPEHNFYRQLKNRLDLTFLYGLTAPYYGNCGQHSIDPAVFFKLCLVGYLENIISERKLIEHCSLRLDLLYFLGYKSWTNLCPGTPLSLAPASFCPSLSLKKCLPVSSRCAWRLGWWPGIPR